MSKKLMKGNEALAEAMIRAGCDAYFGYPITPQSEVIEYLSREATNRTGMVVLQAESEVAAINMIYGSAASGRRVMTTSSSPGISLMQEGLSYIAAAELPCLVANINRGGPGLGTIQPSQGDYFQATKGGGHGDYHLIVLAPSSVQEMVDYTKLGFELAEKYRCPTMLLADGAIGQMMEKVELFEQMPRKTEFPDWATTGKPKNGDRRIITSLFIQPEKMEQINLGLQRKYREIEKNEVRFQTINTEDAEYIFTGFGLGARICTKAMESGRAKGYKIGVVRPQTLYPFPVEIYNQLSKKVKGILDVEMNAGQMVEDVRLAVRGNTRVEFYGRMGGIIATPDEILEYFEKMFL
ncbi:MAG: 3-methyl-2-oxobutanoate dehydrogenase subunit VorB [Ignavibacteria bacterium GWB2_35_12]|nr:MAG: 3-methyl-2-oxobutanoate dehydrogenase subunit VorB [Ignavibacteria bacterium GWB2_35_12]OGU89356.1 MAG: 3-methyl-2-oxobutanoate dehydrogenase subunit VorB [Ignavibacteria bacterium RIFOXYA2_FULL_35_10]OGV19277.1 MAG: 3-methyl-2-oxobutanoate dehydrogenase subunit VorB [Ignavibacteria bacterium RIFOXYC2_FULL_35_21]